ncbi:MAG: acetolactate synthase large subunit [Pseudomonadota bacterium]
MRTGAELFVACLQEAGIDTVYGLPGEENTDLMLALKRAGMPFVLCRHEQGAAMMASVHGRLTGKPAACLATLGPGATNLVTGVADAALDHVPLLAITGQGSTDRLWGESHQIIDLTALFEPITKYSLTLATADYIPKAVHDALEAAKAARPGAVHLSLPEDVAAARTSAEPLPAAPTIAPATVSPAAFAAVAERIAQASSPMIVAGAGVVRTGSAPALAAFAEGTGLPIATTFMAKGVLPPDHPQTLFTLGQPIEDHVDTALKAADLILAVGFDPVEYPPGQLTCAGDTPLISLSEAEIPPAPGWSVELALFGALDAVIAGVHDALGSTSWSLSAEQSAAQAAMQTALSTPRSAANVGPVAPQDILRHVSDGLAPSDIVLSGVGLHKLWIARHLTPKRPGQVLIPNGLAGMGLALPGAIAAARLEPGVRVMAICGDGDVMMNVQEMETATRLGLDLMVMVWVDGGYGLIVDKQDSAAGEHTDLAFGNPDWSHLARAFGWQHFACDGLSSLPQMLAQAQDATGCRLLTIPVDYKDAGKLSSLDQAA